MMEYAIKNDGGDFSKVTLIPNAITNEPLALREKQTDAVWVFYGWSGINAQLEGVECDYWYFKDMDKALDYYTPIIIGNNTFLESHIGQILTGISTEDAKKHENVVHVRRKIGPSESTQKCCR